MRLSRVALVCLASAILLAQSNEIAERLRRALGPEEGPQAVEELARRDYPRLEQRIARRVSAEPARSNELLALEGAVAFLSGDTNGAIGYFERAGELREADAFTLSMALIRSNNTQKAREILEGLTQQHPKKPIYLYWLGKIDYDLRRYTEAVQKLQEALDLDPNSARAWNSLGLAYDMQGQLDQARAALLKAATLNRTLAHPSPWPPNDFGALCLRMNETKLAEDVLREALRYDPNMPQAHYHLARSLEKSGQNSEAISEYKIAIAEDTVSTEACYSLALLYRKLQRYPEANAMLSEYRSRKQAQRP